MITDISLEKKVIYGMQSGNYMSGDEAIAYVTKEIQRQFGEGMRLDEKKSVWKHHGWFMLRFRYTPRFYTIYFEGEFNSFNIRITKDDGAYIALAQLTNYSNNLTKTDLRNAIEELKSVLKTEIAFYKIINGQRYQEADGAYKRIKR